MIRNSPDKSLRETNGHPNEPSADVAPAAVDFVAARSLKRQLFAELRTSWEEGQPITPEALLRRWPTDPQTDPDVASLFREDRWQRGRQDMHSSAGDARYSEPSETDRREEQELLFSVASRGPGDSRLFALPAVGDELFGFRLCEEIGRGSYACVFLAQQQTLASRQVVVKISEIDGNEPQTLAQLQHTHIVPIYSVHEDPQAGLRLVCMPYFGGASLAQVLQALRALSTLPTQGKHLVAALAAVGSAGPLNEEKNDGGPLPLLVRLSYINAATWIVTRLAEALQHAHQRGVLHRDIKPSNVLLSADGQPMLLDFNLAENRQDPAARVGTAVGGTVGYMAPEHLRALARRDPALAQQLDRRADIYGLGMVFYELLTGRRPFAESTAFPPTSAQLEKLAEQRSRGTPSVRSQRPDVPWGLESVARKCLDPDPAKRYQQAEHLAEDLRRYLEDRPLRYAPERSWLERLRKWRRRHPRLAVNGCVAVAVVLLLTVGSVVLAGALRQAQEGRRAIAQETKRLFLQDVAQARCLLNVTIGEQVPVAEGGDVCEKALRRYGLPQDDHWQQRVVWQWLEPEEREQVGEAIRELLLLLARAQLTQAREAPDETNLTANAALTNALYLLDRAEAVGHAYANGETASARAIWEDRAVYLRALGEHERAQEAKAQAEARPPSSAPDHRSLGSFYVRNGRYAEAIGELQQAQAINAHDYWSRFLLGICYRQQGEYWKAALEFATCTTLWPEFSWGYFNLGEAYQQLGQKQEALTAYSTALVRVPPLVQARFNRGLVYLDAGQWQNAREDFDAAEHEGFQNELLYASRGIALSYLGDEAAAAKDFARAKARGWKNVPTRLSYAFLLAQRAPKKAGEIFRELLQQEPDNANALYGCGMLVEHERPVAKEAVDWFTRAIKARPNFVEARLARAVVLARQGHAEEATRDLELCVALDPAGGRTLYGAACVYALLAAKSEPPLKAAWLDGAVQLLREAFRHQYGQEKVRTDADLEALREHPEFRGLLERASQPANPD